MWHDGGLSIVGSTVGNLLFMDMLTEEKKRTTYAKICVEIDMQCKYPNAETVVVDNKRVYNMTIEYNWRPQRCSECESFGDMNAIFLKKERSATVWLKKDIMEGNVECEKEVTVLANNTQQEDGIAEGMHQEQVARSNPTSLIRMHSHQNTEYT